MNEKHLCPPFEPGIPPFQAGKASFGSFGAGNGPDPAASGKTVIRTSRLAFPFAIW
jgi:hypothetical protein